MKHFHDIITDPQNTAERCRFLRQRVQWSIQDVGEAFGYTRAVVSYLENGHRPPSRHIMEHYAELFGCSYDWLMKGEGGPPAIKPEQIKTPPPRPFPTRAEVRAAKRQARALAKLQKQGIVST